MIVGALLLLLGSIFLSAFFSGSETGFFRASRVRIVIAALDGDAISKFLLRLINNPALFVATTLIGNNVANYLASLAAVLLAREAPATSLGELLIPILLSPLMFVYGELLPKNLFYQAPNFLLRLAAPLFLVFTVLLAPAAALLWSLSRILEILLGQSPEKVRTLLARKEVQQALEEGLEAGILHPTQRHLAQGFFLVAARPVGEICTPLARSSALAADASCREARRLARQKQLADIPIYQDQRNNLVGFVRTIDLLLDSRETTLASYVRPLRDVKMSELFGETILQMQAQRETLVKVVNSKGQPVGLLSIDQLTHPLLEGPLSSLKR